MFFLFVSFVLTNLIKINWNILLIYKISFIIRLQDEDNDNPCFPTRNDRMAFINDNMIRERCVRIEEKVNVFANNCFFVLLLENSSRVFKQGS